MKSRSCKQMLPGRERRLREIETQTWMFTWIWTVPLDLQRTSFGPFPTASEMGVSGWDL